MLRLALIGCGRIAQKYLDIFCNKSVRNADLIAVCDVVKYKADKAAQRANVPAFYDMHEMMSQLNDKIDVIIILTESGLHAKHTIELAKYRKHIIVEKPMALSLTDADSMIRACDNSGIKLFVVKQNRYNLPVQHLRKVFDEGAFGKIIMGSVRVRWCRRQDYYDQDPWRGKWSMDGGVFTNQASHHIDLLVWFLGEPISVFAKSRTALANIEAEDTGVAIITFKNGAIGVVEATTATRPTDLEGSLSVLGENGTVEIAGFAVNQMRHWKFTEDKYSNIDFNDASENPDNVYGFGHVRYLNHVVDCIKNDTASLVDGLEGRKSLELINAIYESIETGKEVTLRFQPKLAKLGL